MPARQPNRRSSARRGSRKPPGVSAKKLKSGDGWLLVHPRCALERAEDLEEVRLMIDAGELEVAVDELRWLLSGCSEMMAAHVLLGDLAVEQGPDVPLARGHYGFAMDLGEKALRHTRADGPLPATQLANRPLHQAARGLAWCFEKLNRPVDADGVVEKVRRWDPDDPLGVAPMIDDLRSGGLPIVGLQL